MKELKRLVSQYGEIQKLQRKLGLKINTLSPF